MRIDIVLFYNSYVKRNYSYSKGGIELGESGGDSIKFFFFFD